MGDSTCAAGTTRAAGGGGGTYTHAPGKRNLESHCQRLSGRLYCACLGPVDRGASEKCFSIPLRGFMDCRVLA